MKAAEITEKANTSKKAVSTKVVIAAAMARMAIAVNIFGRVVNDVAKGSFVVL